MSLDSFAAWIRFWCIFLLLSCYGLEVRANESDTSRIHTLIDSAKLLLHSETDRAIDFVNEAIALSVELKYTRGIGLGYNYYGGSAYYKGKHREALRWFNKADSIFTSIQDSAGLALVYSNRGVVYNKTGNFSLALNDYIRAISINEQHNNTTLLGSNYSVLGGIYFRHEEYEQAWKYFRKAFLLDSTQNDSVGMTVALGSLGGALMYQSRFDQAKKHFDRALYLARKTGIKHNELMAMGHLGTYYEQTQHYDTARFYYKQLIGEAKHLDKRQLLCSAYGNMAVTYYKEEKFRLAIDWTRKEITEASGLNDSLQLKEAHYRMAACYEGMGQLEKAYSHLKQYHTLDAALRKKEEKALLENIALNQHLYDQSKQLEQLAYKNQIQQLHIRSKNTYLYGTVVLFTLALLVVVVLLRLNRQKERAKKLELQQQLLKSQINPHFIFNVFNAIQSCLMTKRYDEAELYLRKFSKIIRTFLEKSEFKYTTIEEEIDHMKRYLEVEQLRLGEKLTFEINVDPRLDTANWHMPSFLAQVYLENAIWHGTVGVPNAKVTITWAKTKKGVLLTISDNGMGIDRLKNSKLEGGDGHQSKGMEMTLQRIRLLNRNRKKNKFRVNVLDLSKTEVQQSGTSIEIEIPLIH